MQKKIVADFKFLPKKVQHGYIFAKISTFQYHKTGQAVWNTCSVFTLLKKHVFSRRGERKSEKACLGYPLAQAGQLDWKEIGCV